MRQENITNKHIKDFTESDTVYMKKIIGGAQVGYFCKFISFSRGIVKGEIISADTNPHLHEREAGKIITSRLTNCYLWGNSEADIVTHPHCHWFNKNGTID